jgi:hypothetical protein
MPIRHNIWRVGGKPEALKEGKLETEAVLEEMIVAAPDILSPEWMIICRQEDTGHGGRIDLLALAPDGVLILNELKRAETSREVVAQAIDYAGRAGSLEPAGLGRSSNRPVILTIVSIRGGGSAFLAGSLAETNGYTADMKSLRLIYSLLRYNVGAQLRPRLISGPNLAL